jgi:hypothetical protein
MKSSTILAAVACLGLSSAMVIAQSGKTAGKAANGTAEQKLENFDPKNFSRPTTIDNEWMPLKPGTRFVYEGLSYEDKPTAVAHRFVVSVTDLTKVIGGIRAVISYDLDYADGKLEEAELAFFAQDNDGNVWRMGEYPEEYDGGKFVATLPWIHGIQGAKAGIEMKAKPMPGTPSYSQGWGPAVKWTDRGQVYKVGQKTSVPAGSYQDVLVIAETSSAEPDAQQLKYFARGVGNVRVGWQGSGEKTKETLELTKLEKLDAKALAEVREGALKMEKSGYVHSKDTYARTAPAERMPGTEGTSTAK